jgi:hypothetical protein
MSRGTFIASCVIAAVLGSAREASPVDVALVPQGGGVLLGSVVDVVGRPMPDIEVYIAGTALQTRTDTRGMWRFPSPPPGPRVVVARQVGYLPYVREVLVGGAANDTLTLIMMRPPQTLSAVQIRERSAQMTAAAAEIADRLLQMRVGAGRLFTRDYILVMRPYSIAELLWGTPGVQIKRGQGEVVATTTRAGVGVSTTEGVPCQLQFYLDRTPIDNEFVLQLDPLTFRSVEVYPHTVQLPGLAMRPDRCGAIVINTMRR